MSSKMQTPRAPSDYMLRILQGLFAVWFNHRPDSKMRISVGRTPTSALFKSSAALPNLKPGLRSKALWVLPGNSTFHSNYLLGDRIKRRKASNMADTVLRLQDKTK